MTAASATRCCSALPSGSASTRWRPGPSACSRTSLLRWTRLMRQRYGGTRLALGGGVFMNVKANMLLAGEDWVEDLFAFPSCGDESNAVGAAYLGYVEECQRRGEIPAPAPFGPAYLGPGGHRRRGGGRHPRAPPRGPLQDRRLRPDRGAHRRAARHRRRGGALRRAHGVRRARPRQPLHPGQPLRSPGGRRHQPDDQEPGLLDAVRPDRARRAGPGLPGQPEGPELALHDAGDADPARRPRRHWPRPSIRTTPPRGRRFWSGDGTPPSTT